MLKPESFQTFGGLDLSRPIDEVGSETAIDLLDVDWEATTGTLRSRFGSSALTSAKSEPYESLFPYRISRMLATRGTSIVAINASGEEKTTATIPASGHWSFTRFGTPSASYAYAFQASQEPRRYNGSAFATIGEAMPKGKYACTWTDGGNRLVVAGTAEGNEGPAKALSSASHVWFSEPGNAEAFEETAFVQLSPGDGEEITGICSWGGYVFVFKNTNVFVFYGVSVDEEGRPEFNFRTISLGTFVNAPSTGSNECCTSSSSGVFFVSREGVWRTTGGTPELISTQLIPLANELELKGPASTTFGTHRWNEFRGIYYYKYRVYVFMAELTLIYDTVKQAWLVWRTSLYSLASWRREGVSAGAEELLFFTGRSVNKIFLFAPASSTEPNVTVEPKWQSGFYDMGSDDEKTVTQLKIFGTGKPTIKVAKDFGALGSGSEVQLSETSTPSWQQIQKSQTGSLFSHQFSGPEWSVQRMSRYLEVTSVPASKRK